MQRTFNSQGIFLHSNIQVWIALQINDFSIDWRGLRIWKDGMAKLWKKKDDGNISSHPKRFFEIFLRTPRISRDVHLHQRTVVQITAPMLRILWKQRHLLHSPCIQNMVCALCPATLDRPRLDPKTSSSSIEPLGSTASRKDTQ